MVNCVIVPYVNKLHGHVTCLNSANSNFVLYEFENSSRIRLIRAGDMTHNVDCSLQWRMDNDRMNVVILDNPEHQKTPKKTTLGTTPARQGGGCTWGCTCTRTLHQVGPYIGASRRIRRSTMGAN